MFSSSDSNYPKGLRVIKLFGYENGSINLLFRSKIGLKNSYSLGKSIQDDLKKSSKMSCALLGTISPVIKSSYEVFLIWFESV